MRQAVRFDLGNWVLSQGECLGVPKVLYIILDDPLGAKDKAPRHLEVVDWFCDHSESKPVFKNASCYLVATLRIGKMGDTVDLRL